VILTRKEELLVEAVRALPPEAAEKVMSWARGLADLAKGKPVESSDAWAGEDLPDARAASMRNFEEREAGQGVEVRLAGDRSSMESPGGVPKLSACGSSPVGADLAAPPAQLAARALSVPPRRSCRGRNHASRNPERIRKRKSRRGGHECPRQPLQG
jgi:hypothetical protein